MLLTQRIYHKKAVKRIILLAVESLSFPFMKAIVLVVPILFFNKVISKKSQALKLKLGF